MGVDTEGMPIEREVLLLSTMRASIVWALNVLLIKFQARSNPSHSTQSNTNIVLTDGIPVSSLVA